MSVFYSTNWDGEAAVASTTNDPTRLLWQKGFDVHAQTEDPFDAITGMSEESPIRGNRELAQGNQIGNKIRFTVRGSFHGEGVRGSGNFETGDAFETPTLEDYTMTIDWVRNGWRTDLRAGNITGLTEDIESGFNVALGEWHGREVMANPLWFKMLYGSQDSFVQTYAGGKSSEANLTASDTLSFDEIQLNGAMMGQGGGKPAMTKVVNGQKFRKYVWMLPAEVKYSLETDSTYVQAIEQAAKRGENERMSGNVTEIQGHQIREFMAYDHADAGPIGSVPVPKALLGVAVTSGTATFNIKGGGNATYAADTRAKPFRLFPLYAYTYTPGVTQSWSAFEDGSEDLYVAIINTSGADKGKFGFYRYNSNDGNNLVVSERLAASASGIAATTVGNVVWNANKNTAAHPVGSLIVRTNASGVIMGKSLILGACSAYRGFGKYVGYRPTADEHEAGFIKDQYTWSIIGQEFRKDKLGRPRGFRVVTSAVNPRVFGVELNPTLA